MRLGIVQLSDIHIDNDRHPILHRAELISAAVMSCGLNFDGLILALCGDIAFGGTKEQYDLARGWLEALRARIASACGNIEISVAVVPGNHDCDLRRPSDVREFDLIEPRLTKMDPSGDLARHWLEVQDEYFAFASQLDGTIVSAPTERLFRRTRHSFGGYTVDLNCFNTAWLTQNPEHPSKLYFPVGVIRTPDRAADLCVSLFHHPFNWLDPRNAQEFKRAVERSSDFLLSGHEHVAANYTKWELGGGATTFIEALPLWDPHTEDNGFQLLIIETNERRFCLQRYVWDGRLYSERGTGEWATLAKSHVHLQTTFDISEQFHDELADIGVGFTHSRKRQLCLNDVYVYPDLSHRKIGLVRGICG